MDINRANLDSLFVTVSTAYNGAFKEYKPHWDKVAMLSKSNSSKSVYPFLGKTTQFREWLGDRVIQNLENHDFEIKNKTWENTVGVRREDIEDDNLGIYAPIFGQLGQDAAAHPDKLIFDLLADGFDTECYDGQYFFDDDHPVIVDGEETSVSNLGSGSSTPWYLLDTTRMIKPLIYQERRAYKLVRKDKETDENTFMKNEYVYGVDGRSNVGYGLWQLAYGSKAALSATSYAAARAAMMAFKGDNGRPLGVKPNLLVVPPSLESAAREILLNERDDAGATNTWRNTAELLVVPELA